MRNLPIAYGNSCYAKKWPNKTTTFDELCERLQSTTYTTETVEEYRSCQPIVTKRGGEAAACLRTTEESENVVCRSMLTTTQTMRTMTY